MRKIDERKVIFAPPPSLSSAKCKEVVLEGDSSITANSKQWLSMLANLEWGTSWFRKERRQVFLVIP